MNEYVDGKILVAPPKMGDWRFAKTVLYLWKHDVSGAAGVILNKTMTAPTFKRVCTEAKVKRLEEVNPQMYYGGPIMDNLIGVLHTTDYIIASTNMKKSSDIGYTLDKKNHQRFDKKKDEAFKLPDEGFVINLKSLTKEYDEFAKQNSFKRNLTLPYICKVI